MLKIQQILHILSFLTCCLYRIHGREFTRCPNLNGVARDELRLFDFVLGSRLSCGTKCTEHKTKCLSYAWNKYTKRCICCTLKNVPPNLKHFKRITPGNTIQYKVRAYECSGVANDKNGVKLHCPSFWLLQCQFFFPKKPIIL